MTGRRKLILILGAVVGAGVVAGGTALAARTPDTEDPGERLIHEAFTRTHQGQADVSQAEAEQIAQDAHAGQVVSAHLEDDGPGLEWETEVVGDDGTTWEVNVDARTGSVLNSEADDHDDATTEADDVDGDRDDEVED